MQFSTKKMGVNFFFEKMPNWGGGVRGEFGKRPHFFRFFFFAPFPCPLLLHFSLLSSSLFFFIIVLFLLFCKQNKRILDSRCWPLTVVAVKHTPAINYSPSETLHGSYIYVICNTDSVWTNTTFWKLKCLNFSCQTKASSIFYRCWMCFCLCFFIALDVFFMFFIGCVFLMYYWMCFWCSY